MSGRWIDSLSDEGLLLLNKLIKSDFKISRLSIMENKSPFLIKKRLTRIKDKLNSAKEEKSELKEYLELLVDQDILSVSIANIVYEKHLNIILKDG